MIKNKRTALNSCLLALLGSKHAVNLWWKSPNKGLDNKVPDSLWRHGSTLDRRKVVDYVIGFAFRNI